MFQRILVPLDGSTRAEQALPVAARIARASGGSLVLLRVVSQAGEHGDASTHASHAKEEVSETAYAKATEYLNTLATSAGLAGVKTQSEVLFGAPDQGILNAVQADNADLILMCSRGRTGFKRWALGSVSHKLAHATTIPLLVLHESEAKPSLLRSTLAYPLCGLVALDGSALAEEALIPAANLVAALSPGQGALFLTFVVTDIGQEAQRQAKAYQADVEKRVLEGLHDLNLSIRWLFPRDADVTGELLDIAQGGQGSGGCDFIAMSTHGRGGLERFMMGSVTEHVLNATKLPMLLVRPQHAAMK